MSRFDHPSYRSSSAPARTAQQPTTEDSGGAEPFASAAAPSPWPLLLFAVLVTLGVLLTTGLLP